MPESSVGDCRNCPTDITVVVAAGSSLDGLRRCLQGLVQQSASSATYDVVVIRYSRLAGVRDPLDQDAPFAVASFALATQFAAEALNAGVALASGSFCLLLGGDVIPDCDLVAKHLAAQREGGGVIGLGRVKTMPRANHKWFARAHATVRGQVDARSAASPTWRHCDRRNLCVPTETLRACGGFVVDAPFSAAELGFRLGRLGTALKQVPEAVVACDDRRDGRALVADMERQGWDAVRLGASEPHMLPGLLGAFGDGGPREGAVRRPLLALRVPTRATLALAGLVRPLAGSTRCHAFAFRYAFWSGVRRHVDRDRWRRLTRGVPVLMYHAFAQPGEPATRHVISRHRFVLHMLVLRLLRYQVVGLEQLLLPTGRQSLPPRRKVVITIDDGYMDNYEVAFPILRRFGYPATVFLVSGRIGQTNDWDADGELAGRSLLDRPRILEMADGGIRFGAHTKTHPCLPSLAAAGAGEEVSGSRRDLEHTLRTTVDTFAFPYGDWDAEAVQAARRAGFLGACTTRPRPSYPDGQPMLIDRIEMRGNDSLIVFLRKLRRGG